MGPDLIIITIAYYGSAMVALGLLIGIVVKKSRRYALITLGVASAAAVWGALSSVPYWEKVAAGINFALVGIGIGGFFAIWKICTWLLRKLRGQAGTVIHG